jgi:hypothetical protein
MGLMTGYRLPLAQVVAAAAVRCALFQVHYDVLVLYLYDRNPLAPTSYSQLLTS